jgi:hypothetical protein
MLTSGTFRDQAWTREGTDVDIGKKQNAAEVQNGRDTIICMVHLLKKQA